MLLIPEKSMSHMNFGIEKLFRCMILYNCNEFFFYWDIVQPPLRNISYVNECPPGLFGTIPYRTELFGTFLSIPEQYHREIEWNFQGIHSTLSKCFRVFLVQHAWKHNYYYTQYRAETIMLSCQWDEKLLWVWVSLILNQTCVATSFT